MIFYFTGTGNSFVAGILTENLNEISVSINEIFRDRRTWRFYSETPYVSVAPIYAGAAEKYCKKIIEQKSMTFTGFKGLCMPDNYLVSNRMPEKEEVIAEIRKSYPEIREAANAVKNHTRFTQ